MAARVSFNVEVCIAGRSAWLVRPVRPPETRCKAPRLGFSGVKLCQLRLLGLLGSVWVPALGLKARIL